MHVLLKIGFPSQPYLSTTSSNVYHASELYHLWRPKTMTKSLNSHGITWGLGSTVSSIYNIYTYIHIIVSNMMSFPRSHSLFTWFATKSTSSLEQSEPWKYSQSEIFFNENMTSSSALQLIERWVKWSFLELARRKVTLEGFTVGKGWGWGHRDGGTGKEVILRQEYDCSQLANNNNTNNNNNNNSNNNNNGGIACNHLISWL